MASKHSLSSLFFELVFPAIVGGCSAVGGALIALGGGAGDVALLGAALFGVLGIVVGRYVGAVIAVVWLTAGEVRKGNWVPFLCGVAFAGYIGLRLALENAGESLYFVAFALAVGWIMGAGLGAAVQAVWRRVQGFASRIVG